MNYGKRGVRDKQKTLRSKSSKWGRKIALTFIKVLLIGIIAVGIVGAASGIGLFKGIIASAPTLNVNEVAPSGFSTFVYDNQGNQMAKLVASNSNRIPVTMDMIPQNLANAFVAIEDERFYTHNGIDIQGIIRSGYQFIKTGGDEAQGASTITQQLLKNTIFTDWVNEESMIEKLERKFQEQYLALEISKILSKEEVLERYMNVINLGQNTLGVQAASQRYFNKSVSDLTLSECSVIAAITQNPSKYNPISHPDYNSERRKRVLNKMLDLEFITKEDYDEALTDDVYSRIQTVNIEISNNSTNSYFVDAVSEVVYGDLIEAGYSATQASIMLYSGGLHIHSTMDPDIQGIVDEEFANPDNFPINTKWYLSYELTVTNKEGETVNHSKEMMQTYFQNNVDKKFNLIFSSQDDGLAAIEQYKAAVLAETDEVVSENYNFVIQPQMSMTILDQATGNVVALVGGRGTKEANRTLNRAKNTTRPPGSCFKILAAYAPALDSAGLTLATVINDAPFAYVDGVLVNNWYKTGYRGINSLRKGIEQSMNVSTVKLLTMITPQLGFDYLENFGFTTLDRSKDAYQSLALGGLDKGVTNLELNAAFASIANGGVYTKPKLYTQVLDSDGNVILDNTERESHQVLKETTAFLLTDAMVDAVTIGTGKAVKFSNNMAIAGKTGTTSNYRDVWFSGYTPYYTATVWTGYDNNIEMNETSKNPETSLSKTLWRVIMARVHEDLPNQTFPIPGGIVQMTVCSRSGKLPLPGLCDAHLVTEYFDENAIPTENCDLHYSGTICAYTHLRATADCPFKIEGSVELPLVEDASLISGSTIISENPDGTISTTMPVTSQDCPHNAAFFEIPENHALLEQQRAELAAQGYLFEQQY